MSPRRPRRPVNVIEELKAAARGWWKVPRNLVIAVVLVAVLAVAVGLLLGKPRCSGSYSIGSFVLFRC